MYPVSDTFEEYIKKNTVTFEWYGTITDLEGNEYDITKENIAKNTGKITRRCSGQEQLAIGTTCAAELSMNLYLDVDRYTLYGATVELYFRLYEGVTANDEPITEDIPMGIFTISECNQTNGQLNIIAYDNMTKFDDEPFVPYLHQEIQSPYAWLYAACATCGVTLGQTMADIKRMPNGKRYTGYTDVDASVATWKDVVGRIATILGGFAYIGRDGKLYIGTYTNNVVDTINPSHRFKSNLSDYRTTYEGIHNICVAAGEQEYASNDNEDGLVLDIGTNPFLQFTRQVTRIKALQEIINIWNDVYYVPFEATIPIMPHYDPGDVISFTGNQAAEYDYAAITEMVYAIGGQMSIRCSGDNPRLVGAQDKFSKTVEGLSGGYNNTNGSGNNGFWILHTSNTDAITVTDEEIQITEIEWVQTTVVQDIEMIVIIDAELSASAQVKLRLVVDDDEDYEIEVVTEREFKGTRPFHGSNPQRIVGKGTHTAKVYMTVTDSPILVGDLL